MRWKTSWYKHELMKQNFRQVGWLSLIYFLVLFFSVPLNIFMQLNQKANHYPLYDNNYYSIFEISPLIQVSMLFIIPVLMGMFSLRYLHQKDASDFLHSLPISRIKLFWQQVGFGLIALWIPIVINALFIFLINQMLDTSHMFTSVDGGFWLLMSIVLITFVYSVSLIVGVMTGITIIQGIFTYLLLFFPVGFTFLFVYNLDFAIIGLPESHFISDRLLTYSPLTDIFELILPYDEISDIKIVTYFVLTVVFLMLAQTIYQHRPAEAATQAIAFQILKPIFIYSFTFCFTLIGGLYFGLIQQSYLGIVIGYFLFSLIGYFISQMVIHKTWRVFGEWREYRIFFLGFVMLTLLIVTDLIGFQSRIPDSEDIASVFVTDDVYVFNEKLNQFDDLEGFTNTEDIERIRDYHQYLMDNVTRENALDHDTTPIRIIYNLENGKKMVREYHIYWDEYDELFEELKVSPTYKKYTNMIFMIDPARINKIHFYTYPWYKEVTITNRNQMDELIEQFKLDILASSGNEGSIGTSVTLESVNDYYDHISLEIYKDYHRVINWLEENGLAEHILLQDNDIESMTLAYADQNINYTEDRDFYGPDYYSANILTGLEQVNITDRELIKVLSDRIDYEQYEGDYLLAIYLVDADEPYIIAISQSEIPDEILEQLN